MVRPGGDRGIAVQDLGKEQMDDRHGVKQTVAPGVIDLAAGICDLGSVELFGRGLLELAKDANDSAVHNVLPAKVVSVYHLYGREHQFVQLVLDMTFMSIGLMPFSYVPFSRPFPGPDALEPSSWVYLPVGYAEANRTSATCQRCNACPSQFYFTRSSEARGWR
jgi:hypothetical protein